ncbi:hypothetical protein BJ508DRAFT_307997 [Ascobolus immersus RN42]|uniref:Uncharacterized protein n=1 Tax=Ascobolus immersus RN42 TaxID=1160509 RepID=A0A3N4I355_ASCIM|nr:hypothetical protein BJ508DRAFT_307997 [Ascobolus immersus RN42]
MVQAEVDSGTRIKYCKHLQLEFPLHRIEVADATAYEKHMRNPHILKAKKLQNAVTGNNGAEVLKYARDSRISNARITGSTGSSAWTEQSQSTFVKQDMEQPARPTHGTGTGLSNVDIRMYDYEHNDTEPNTLLLHAQTQALPEITREYSAVLNKLKHRYDTHISSKAS